jgi:hypothetical protein
MIRLLLLSVLACGTVVHAATPEDTDADRVASKLLKDRAAEALARGDYGTARDLFQQAYDRFPSPNYLFNLGLAFSKLNEPARAAQAFDRFLAESSDPPVDAARFARAQIEALSAQLGRVRVVTAVEGVDVRLDDRRVGATPLRSTLWDTPGLHRLILSKTGYHPLEVMVALVAGVIEEPVITLMPEQVAPPTRPAPRHDRRWLVRRPWFWVAVTVPVVALGLGVGLGLGLRAKSFDPTLPETPLP